MPINHLVVPLSRYIYHYLINPSLENEEIFVVIFHRFTLNSYHSCNCWIFWDRERRTLGWFFL